MKKRNRYTGKFKSKVALAAVENIKTIAELASDYGVHPGMIRNWKRQLIENSVDIFTDKRKREKDDNSALLDELYRQIGQLKVELDWLKKKSGLLE